MPVKSALEGSGRFFRETAAPAARAIRSHAVETPGAVAANRLVSGTSTIAVGGSIAAVVTYYVQPPEALHAHVVALVIFAWQSLVFAVGWYFQNR